MNHYELLERMKENPVLRAAINVESVAKDLQDEALLKQLQSIFRVLGETTRAALTNGEEVVLPGIGRFVHHKTQDGPVVRFRASPVLKMEMNLGHKGAEHAIQS